MADKEEIALRPVSLAEIVGQEVVKQQLHIEIEGAKVRNEALGHVLLSGRPGLGKTTFAQAIASALEKPIIYADGPSLDKAGIRRLIDRELAPSEEAKAMYASLNIPKTDGGVLLSDEIHAIPKTSFETLYTLMEDFKHEGKEVEPFTLIGATTDPGKLPFAFRSRFIVQVVIDYYDDLSLWELLKRSYRALEGIEPSEVTVESLRSIAIRARGTPRLANNLLRRVRNVQSFHKEDSITPDVLKESMRMMGIDFFGLDESDRQFLMALEELGRPSGTAAIAGKMGATKETVEEVVEPWLVRKGYVERGQKGRFLTSEGYGVIKVLEYTDESQIF